MLEVAAEIVANSTDPRREEAMREINVLRAGVKYYQLVLHRMDRDDQVIQSAIDEAKWLRNKELARRLKQLLEPVKVPYEAMIGDVL